jgi:hypothetical protein
MPKFGVLDSMFPYEAWLGDDIYAYVAAILTLPGSLISLNPLNLTNSVCRLWPYSVTQQKVARSWSTQVDLMERYPEHRFACSSAQQYKWLEEVSEHLLKYHF